MRIDVAEFAQAWRGIWPSVLPVRDELRVRFAARWVRFSMLPQNQRYATTDAEHAEIIRRHRALLEALLAGNGTGLVVITCSWSASAEPVPRDQAVAGAMPDAEYWRSDDHAIEPGFSSWTHHYVSMTGLTDPALDALLRVVANDLTDGVVITAPMDKWLYCPFDGGADVIATSPESRDQLATTYQRWLAPTRPRGG